MFPKGPRFQPLKIPDGPAPNAYSPVDPHLEPYKRGAFLEKASRFSQHKHADLPGPAACSTNSDAPKPMPPKLQTPMNERYNLLQKKLEDLEHVHLEGKKTHQADLDRLKSELSRCQVTITDQTERIDKQKRQNDTLDFRIQELKKAAHVNQTEIKELRTKLKMAEHDKALLTTKQGDVAEIKRSMQSLDSKHRNDIRERDQRIAELEKAAASEKKKRQLSETKLQEFEHRGNDDAQTARNAVKKAETQLTNTQQELSEVRGELATIQNALAQEREDSLTRLSHYHSLLSSAAALYGQLASNAIPAPNHDKLKQFHTAAEVKILRLERKLSNTEEQVLELVHLVRQANERNGLLTEQLDDAIYQLSIYENMLTDTSPPPSFDYHDSLRHQLEQLRREDNTHREESQKVEQQLLRHLSNYYSLGSQQLLLAYICVDKELTQASALAHQHSRDLASTLASHEAIAASLESLQKAHSELEEEARTLKASHATAQQTCTSLEEQVDTLKEQTRESTRARDAALKKERDTIQRLTATVQKSRMGEDALRAEIDRLLAELADAERFQEAYYSLSEEIGALLARNQLAEEEAERLSQFNAEILGHHNPAQRIAYVDRIRRELADAKHKIVTLSREQEVYFGLNTDLQHELDMYQSVMTSKKPKTHITRVQRMPLSNVTRNLNASSMNIIQQTPQTEVIDIITGDDMTLDEIT